MSDEKKARILQVASLAKKKLQRDLLSLHHCLARSDVMRHHHEALIKQMVKAEGPAAFNDLKKVRFGAYIAFWFTGLACVIERYEQLRNNSSIPSDVAIDNLITIKFKNTVRDFRNSVAHCSDFDDKRILKLYELESTVPDHAIALAKAFHAYLRIHKFANA